VVRDAACLYHEVSGEPAWPRYREIIVEELVLTTDPSTGLPFGYERTESVCRLFTVNLRVEDEHTTDFTTPRPPLEADEE